MTNRDIAVVIGAGPGLGAALVRRFATGGCDVAMIARDAARLDALADDIGGPTRIRGFPADAADPASLTAALARIAAEMGPPAILIHAVSRWVSAKATEMELKILQDELMLGPVSALAASQAVLPAMRAAGRGTILWTGSRMGLEPATAGPPAPALAAAKTALRGLALAAAPAFHAEGVTFSTITIDGGIEPGTPFDPARIAEAFWRVHTAPPQDWRAEHIFRGA